MPDITLRIEQSNNTERLDGIEAEYTRSFKEQARGEVVVYRSDWNAISGSIDERNDKLFINIDGTDEFGGRYGDAERQDAQVSIRLDSPEIDAADAEPTDDNKTYINVTADKIATDAINAVPTLSTGTINTSPAGLSYSVSHGSRSKILYDLREMSGIEFRYNADFTVDVKDRIGSGRNITLGPAEANIGEDWNKTVDQRENITHVRVLGGESGPNQVTAEAVSSNYAAGRKVWKRHAKNEVITQARAQDIADALIADYENDPRSVEVECEIYNEDLHLGDTVTVDYPAENINRDLRIVSLTTQITRRGVILLAALSNRTLTREVTGETKRNDDVDTHNRGHGGFVDRDQVTSGWNPAGDGTPQTLEVVNWPDDIVTEQTVELTVQGRAWRSPVDPLSHDHSVTIPDHNHDVDVTHPSHSHDVTHPSHTHDVTHPSHSHDVDVTHPSHDHDVTHPSHDHDVTHPSHDHDINTTSDAVPAKDGTTLYASGGTDNFTFSTPGETLDTFSASKFSWPYVVSASIAADDTAGEDFSQVGLRVRAPGFSSGQTVWNLSRATNSASRSFTRTSGGTVIFRDLQNSKLELEAQVSWETAGAKDATWSWVIYQVDPHSHGVTDTSTTELGTTETSTTALGTTETSTTALGTTNTETSTTELGTNETSTTALGTNETSTTALGTTNTETTKDGGATTQTTTTTTGLDPNVITSFNNNTYYPTDVDIEVNGTVITTLAGDNAADWEDTVDLTGELNAGSNTIKATPTGQRGSLNLTLASELFRRGEVS